MFAHGHDVALAEGGVLNKATGQRNLWVNSVHYQGIARLGDGLRVEAAAPDGVIEAVSARVNGAPVLGVQWHPEWNTAADPNSVTSFHPPGRSSEERRVGKARVRPCSCRWSPSH